MDIGLLCLAVRDLVRDALNSDNYPARPFLPEEIEVMPEPYPPPHMNQQFIAVVGAEWTPALTDSNVALDYNLGVDCVLTVRSSAIPLQKQGVQMFAKEYSGMSRICLEIAKAVSMKTTLYTKLASYDSYQAVMFEYLRWTGVDASPTPCEAGWFHGYDENQTDLRNGLHNFGYRMTVNFRNARGGILQSTS